MRHTALGRGITLFALIATASVAAAAGAAEAQASCEGVECGVPSCWEQPVHTRPGATRKVQLSCDRVTAVNVVSGPEHGEVTDVDVHEYGTEFTLRVDEDAPRWDEAVFEVTGHAKSIETRVGIEVIPTSENQAPSCWTSDATQRSDGGGPVELYVSAWCYDPEDDAFVMEGAGPGVHVSSPMQVPAGAYQPSWYYRTATHAGTETASVWAEDALGARSATSMFDVTVGPGVDRLPECWVNGSYWGGEDGVATILSRPGAARSFGISCSDADSDPFATRLSQPPTGGVLTLVPDPPVATYGYQSLDARYVPVESGSESDEMAVTPESASGPGPATRVRIVPRALPENAGGYCSPWALTVDVGGTGTAEVGCMDDEGDPLTAEVVGEPLHGTAGPAAVVADSYGYQRVKIPYVPEADYEGYDCIKVVVSDGNGSSYEMTLDIDVRKAPEYWTPPGWSYPYPPYSMAPPPRPPEAGGGPAAPAPSAPPTRDAVRVAARTALGVDDVQRIASTGRTEVWTPARLSKRTLIQRGRAPGLYVFCPARCDVRSTTALRTGGAMPARMSRRRAVLEIAGGEARAVWVTLGRGERSSLRRARKASALFRLGIRSPGTTRRPLRPSVPIRR